MGTRLYGFLRQGAHFVARALIAPRSPREDDARREFILNIILCASILLLVVLDLIMLRSSLEKGSAYRGISLPLFTSILLVFVNLLVLSRKGYFVWASYILVGIYFASLMYASYRWGVQLPIAMLGFTIVIVVAGIVLGTKSGFFVTFAIGLFMTVLGYYQIKAALHPKLYWRTEDITIRDPIMYFVIYLLIMTVSWLGNREIEKSLRRARKSEAELKHERDNLEIRVEERTKELKLAQSEKISQLYRFAEFGRVSAGAFHDLMSSVTSLNLYIDELSGMIDPRVTKAQGLIGKALSASRKMDGFISTIKKQTDAEGGVHDFSLNEETEQAIELLMYKAHNARVDCRFEADENVMMRGNALKFHQVALNLISNAIDAYDLLDKEGGSPRLVLVRLKIEGGSATLRVEDSGIGIPQDITEKIFDPFFTTKPANKGTGLGLFTVKNILEKDFRGSMEVVSLPGKGSAFVIRIPIHNDLSNHT